MSVDSFMCNHIFLRASCHAPISQLRCPGKTLNQHQDVVSRIYRYYAKHAVEWMTWNKIFLSPPHPADVVPTTHHPCRGFRRSLILEEPGPLSGKSCWDLVQTSQLHPFKRHLLIRTCEKYLFTWVPLCIKADFCANISPYMVSLLILTRSFGITFC